MMRAGYKQTPEHIEKRAAFNRGRKRSPEAIEKTAAALRGRTYSEARRLDMSLARRGKQYALGCKRDEAFRRKLSDYYRSNPEKHNHYVDGKAAERSSARVAEMGRLDYRLWREAVFARDNFTCQDCGQRGGRLEADHIKPYSLFPDLRPDVDNGRTLCRPCHRLTDTHCGRIALYKRRLAEEIASAA